MRIHLGFGEAHNDAESIEGDRAQAIEFSDAHHSPREREVTRTSNGWRKKTVKDG